MLDRPATAAAATRADLLTFAQARMRADEGGALAVLADWVETYLMQGHPDLGRTGAVCPFTRQAGKLDTIRLNLSLAGSGDEEAAFALVRRGFTDLNAIPAKPGMEHFRTVISGFPNCAGDEGIAMLRRVQRRHKLHSLARFRMIGFMHPASEDQGLWNPAFRPLRAPMPVLAIRHMVEQDAPFAAHHPLLMAPYLLKFRLDGAKRLIAYRRAH